MELSKKGLWCNTGDSWGLKTAGGKVYPLRKHENVDALFVEKTAPDQGVPADSTKGRGILAMV
jgi:hypothetical protein